MFISWFWKCISLINTIINYFWKSRKHALIFYNQIVVYFFVRNYVLKQSFTEMWSGDKTIFLLIYVLNRYSPLYVSLLSLYAYISLYVYISLLSLYEYFRSYIWKIGLNHVFGAQNHAIMFVYAISLFKYIILWHFDIIILQHKYLWFFIL